jgi:hypothetical protein
MRPYLAIITDSFREALASRVLWLLIILITVILAGLAPFGMKTELAYQVTARDIRRPSELVDRLGKKNLLQIDAIANHVRSLLPDELRGRIDQNDPRLRSDLARELTKLMDRGDFYQPELWNRLDLGDEGKALVALRTQKSQAQLRRLNRIALEVAFPRSIRPASSESTIFTYGVWDLEIPPIPTRYVDKLIKDSVAGFTSFFVGQLGVFAAVLVTASIIPNTFDAGSVLLLLSKPISRPLLYLAKFLGGCSFVLINATYLVSGLWLLVGIRLNIWQHRLLLCIPVFLFLFAIYYSVSGLVGLVWRNSVICIAVTVLFWFACSLVGSAKLMIDTFVHDPNRFNKLLAFDDELFATTNAGGLLRWDAQAEDWQDLAIGTRTGGRLGGNGDPNLVAVQADQRLVKISGRRITTREAGSSWTATDVGSLPDEAEAIVAEPDGRLLAIATSAVFRLSDELKPAEPPPSLFGFEIPIPREETNYSRVEIDLPNLIRGRFSITANAQRSTLVLWHDGRLSTFRKNESGGYTRVNQQTIQESHQDAIVASAADTVLVALADGRVETFDHDEMEPRNSYLPFQHNQPRFAIASADGSYFAVVFHTGQVFLIDVRTGQGVRLPILDGKDTTCVQFVGPSKMLAADMARRVRAIDLASGTVDHVWRGQRSLVETVSQFVIDPIYTLFPKPGRLEETVRYILTRRETMETSSFEDDLSQTQMRLDPWSPVYSSLAFMIVMLVISCVYITRQEY